MSIEGIRAAFSALEANLEEIRAALLALPGVHRVEVSLRIRDAATRAEFTVYYTDVVDFSREDLEQAVGKVQQIKSAAARCPFLIGVKYIGPRD